MKGAVTQARYHSWDTSMPSTQEKNRMQEEFGAAVITESLYCRKRHPMTQVFSSQTRVMSVDWSSADCSLL